MGRVDDYKYQIAKKTIRQRPFSMELNYAAIVDTAWQIQSDCTDVQWADDQLEDILGDEVASEFRLQYSDLATAVEQFLNEIEEYSKTWTFDGEERGESYIDAMIAASGGCDDLMLYEGGSESEYTPLTGFVEEQYERMAAARIKALTKDRIIELVGDVLWIVRSYWDIKARYQLLAGIFELIQEEGCQELDAVKGVEEAWAAWDAQKSMEADSRLRSAIRQLPDIVWLH